MQISFVAPQAVLRAPGPGALAVGILDGGELSASAAKVDAATGGAVTRAVELGHFRGQSGKALDLLAPWGVKASRIVLVGLGKAKAFDGAAAERVAALVVGRLNTGGEEKITFALDVPPASKLSPAALAAHLAFGATLRGYRFDIYRTKLKDDKPTLKHVAVATRAVAGARKAWKEFSAVGEGVFLARDLTNEPPNILHPDAFAKRARSLANLGVKVQVLNVAQMAKLGMNALLAVGQGSVRESRLVVMQWDGAPKNRKRTAPLVFVGKGVCFDSGGLSLKSAGSMVGMKGDMAGAAVVVGVMHALAKRKARVNVVGLIGLTENMPDGKAQRPNDIVKTMSGQTVEVLNTDAEGRLVLADVLWYAQSRFRPRFMVDLATLTGAILVSLGSEHAGLFSNNDQLSERLTRAGLAEGEPVWRLPLGDAYDKLLRSKIADMKNIGGPGAGSITAAQFLQRFVNKVPWAHLDIAGVAWQDHEQKPLAPSWGTGWGVRLLDRLVATYYEK
ncbi:MAG: leucyl aminopeptidase [Proteobacteria bacterium]|nr:leucyl aminopeptidase [Pseudomonadota bacterium]